MMLAYINIFKPNRVNLQIDDEILLTLETKGWSIQIGSNKRYFAFDVMNNPKKYKNEMKKIKNADLKYPIIVNNSIHRLAKSYMKKLLTIKCYIFDSTGNWKKIINMQLWEIMDIFYDRFKTNNIC